MSIRSLKIALGTQQAGEILGLHRFGGSVTPVVPPQRNRTEHLPRQVTFCHICRVDYSRLTEKQLKRLGPQLDILSAESDRWLASQDARAAAIESRAGLLTGAAAILGTVQATTQSTVWVYVLLSLSFLAAVCGLYVLKPRWQFNLDPALVIDAVLERTPRTAQFRVIREKKWIFKQRERSLTTRAVVVLIGYCLIAASVVVSLVIATTPIAPKATGG